MADDLSPDATIEDIEEHIAFLDVCIDSLDDNSSDYNAQLQDLERKKQEAEQRLQDYVTPPSSPEPAAAMSSQFSNLLSPTPKRGPRPSFDEPDHPFKRATPNPPDSLTPRSSAGSLRLGSQQTPSIHDRIRQRQLDAEKSIEQRHQQRASDERYARELSSVPHTFTRPSATQQSSRQTTIGASGTWERPPQVKPEPGLFSNNSSSRHIKPEPSLFPRAGINVAGRGPSTPLEVVDLTESDDDVLELGNRSNGPPLSYNPAFSRNLPMPSAMRSGLVPPQRPQAPVVPSMHIPGAFPGDNSMYSANPYGYTMPTSSLSAYGNTNGSSRAYQYGLNPLTSAAPVLPGDPVPGPSRSTAWPPSIDDDLVYAGSRAKNLGAGNYAGYEDLYNRRYEDVHTYDPAKTKEEINALLANISPDDEMPAHLTFVQPEGLTVRLHKYQAMGLEWLKKCESGTNKGGILADDMGLGKTVQMISLMLENRSRDPSHRLNLIVAPVALLRQWKQEIETKVKPGRHRFNVFIHHGSSKKKDFRDFLDYDVVITTYGSLAVEFKKKTEFDKRRAQDPNARPNKKEKTVFIGEGIKWYRIILDESQFIKNRRTRTAGAAALLRADYRFCVTGTPMMNNIEELYSLISFLQIRPYCVWDKFRCDFNPLLKDKKKNDDLGVTRESAMSKLQVLCKAVMLRRTKSSKYEGQPILVLPEKTTMIDNPEFDEAELDFYKALETNSAVTFNKYRKAGSVYSSYAHILVMLLRLRQACCHPHLVKDFSIMAAAGVTATTMEELAETLAPDVIRRVMEKDGAFECSVCWDAVQNPGIFIPCGHYTCADCLTSLMDNAAQSGENGAENGTTARCPECRGEINTKKLVDYETFKKVHQPELFEKENEGESNGAAASETEDDSEESDSDSDDDESDDMADFIVDDDESIHEGSDEEGDTEMGAIKNENSDEDRKEKKKLKKKFKLPGDKGKEMAKKKKAKAKRKAKDKEVRKAKEKQDTERMLKKSFEKMSVPELKKLSTRNAAARREYLRRLRESWTSSAKIEKTLEILRTIMGAPEGEKVLVFSQWTSLLDLVEVPIDEAGWGYRRYDGSMNANQRAEAVDDFKDPRKNVRIMLVSLKAGNAGLNLNVASQVVILDPFWNPYIEDQAVDRAHRLGQTRPVEIHRMLIQNTVEDRIMELQERKRALISEALDEGAGKRMARLGVNELAYLFGVTSNPNERLNYQEARRR